MTRKRRKPRSMDRETRLMYGGMHGMSRDAADRLSMLTGNLADCLADDGRFLRQVTEGCPEVLPMAALVRHANHMAESQSLQWRTLANQFRAFADGKPVELPMATEGGGGR
jgi:hypothetical protein